MVGAIWGVYLREPWFSASLLRLLMATVPRLRISHFSKFPSVLKQHCLPSSRWGPSHSPSWLPKASSSVPSSLPITLLSVLSTPCYPCCSLTITSSHNLSTKTSFQGVSQVGFLLLPFLKPFKHSLPLQPKLQILPRAAKSCPPLLRQTGLFPQAATWSSCWTWWISIASPLRCRYVCFMPLA